MEKGKGWSHVTSTKTNKFVPLDGIFKILNKM